MTQKHSPNTKNSLSPAVHATKKIGCFSADSSQSPYLPPKPSYTVATKIENNNPPDPDNVTAAMLDYIENYKNTAIKNS